MEETKRDVFNLVNDDIKEMINTFQNLKEETIRWHPAPEAWSIMQIAAHVAEAVPYWIDLAEKIIRDPNTKIDRGMFSKDRLYAISEENTQNMSIKNAINGLEKIPQRVQALLQSLTHEQFQEESVQYILDVEVIKHIEGHTQQMKRNLADKEKHEGMLTFSFLNR